MGRFIRVYQMYLDRLSERGLESTIINFRSITEVEKENNRRWGPAAQMWGRQVWIQLYLPECPWPVSARELDPSRNTRSCVCIHCSPCHIDESTEHSVETQ